MAQYKLLTIEDTPTTTGKPKKTATVEGYPNKVGVWSDFPNYANLVAGMSVEGDIKDSPDGKWHNLVFVSSSVQRPPYGQRSASGGGKKWTPEDSKKVQEVKDLSFKIAGTQRDAVLIVTTFLPKDSSMDFVKSQIEHWRQWLWENYDAKDTDFAPSGFQPKIESYGTPYPERTEANTSNFDISDAEAEARFKGM